MNHETWILGATGRVGRAAAAELSLTGVPLVLAGRDPARLAEVASALEGEPRLVTGSLPDILAELARATPAAVLNTVGPFPVTAPQVLAACSPTTHYVDVANEQVAVSAALHRDPSLDPARTVVTGAGFGVLGTESAALMAAAGRPPATSLRVDAIASVRNEGGRLGAALAHSLVDSIVLGGQQVAGGHLVPARLAQTPLELTTPDGDHVRTAGMPSGEVLAA